MAKFDPIEDKADRLYSFIRAHLMEHARSPSHREMAAGIQASPETVLKCLALLEQQGRGIHRIRGRARQVWLDGVGGTDDVDAGRVERGGRAT